jgi:hypothetical protein
MANLQNLTPFAAMARPSIDRNAVDVLLICVAARFLLPPPNVQHDDPPEASAVQAPPVMADEYWGAPDRTSLKREGQATYYRPCTDVHVLGHAWAPEGRPVQTMAAGIEIADRRTVAVITGDRVWERGFSGGLVPSPPMPFETMPLVWERAFGGRLSEDDQSAAYETRNPVGVGMYASAERALGKRLPNIEHPQQQLTSIHDRPTPVGFGPIARHWSPRREYGGTYNDQWVRTRAPFWPLDFDERFFCAAPASLQFTPHLRGGERVRLAGFHPEGIHDFPLPTYRFVADSAFKNTSDTRRLVLDAITFEPDDHAFTMIWRTAVPVGRNLPAHRVSTLRELESWERD